MVKRVSLDATESWTGDPQQHDYNQKCVEMEDTSSINVIMTEQDDEDWLEGLEYNNTEMLLPQRMMLEPQLPSCQMEDAESDLELEEICFDAGTTNETTKQCQESQDDRLIPGKVTPVTTTTPTTTITTPLPLSAVNHLLPVHKNAVDDSSSNPPTLLLIKTTVEKKGNNNDNSEGQEEDPEMLQDRFDQQAAQLSAALHKSRESRKYLVSLKQRLKHNKKQRANLAKVLKEIENSSRQIDQHVIQKRQLQEP